MTTDDRDERDERDASAALAEELVDIVSTSSRPAGLVGEMIARLIEQGVIDEDHIVALSENLQALGLGTGQLTAQGAVRSSNVEEINAAIRLYDRQVDEILARKDVTLNGMARERLRTTLARFAADNEILDLHTALRLMQAEQPDIVARLLDGS